MASTLRPKKTVKNQQAAVARRIERDKQAMVEILARLPIIQVACKRVGISRATFYRWKEEDSEFETAAGDALKEGSQVINDLAKSKLIEQINQSNLTAIIFWLKSRDPQFIEKRRFQTNFTTTSVSPEQEILIRKTLGHWAHLKPTRPYSTTELEKRRPGFRVKPSTVK